MGGEEEEENNRTDGATNTGKFCPFCLRTVAGWRGRGLVERGGALCVE